MLGTFVGIDCRAADPIAAEAAVEAAYAAIRCVDERMHPTRADSDIALIRAAPLGQTVRIHAWTWQVLALAKHIHELSGGWFDPCLPDESGNMADVQLSAPDVAVRTAPAAVDLGGIAKGFAVDRAIDALQAAGCTEGWVNAGGDMRVYGAGDVPIWVDTNSGIRSIRLIDEACAVSDASHAARPAEHRGYYSRVADSRIDMTHMRPAVVVAATAAVADALTKCVLLLGAANEHRTLEELLVRLGAKSM